MKKRVLAGIMMAVMMMASVMGVSAANSKDTSLKVDGNTLVAERVEDQSIATSASKESSVAGKTSISAVYTIKAADGATATPDADGKFAVKLTVASLSDKCTNIVVLCYDAGTQAWKSITVDAKNVDYANKTIEVKLPALGQQIVVYANVATGGAAGTSPSTVGTSSTWMLCLAAALIVVGAGVIATQKKSR